MSKRHLFGDLRAKWLGQILALLLTSCVTLGNLTSLCLFFICKKKKKGKQKEGGNSTYLSRHIAGIESINVSTLEAVSITQ